MKPKVLVVEDEIIVAMDLGERIKAEDYEVVGVASSGTEAIAWARQTSPEVILMDVQLVGEMDGIEAAKQIAQFCSSTIIFLTANSEREIRERAGPAVPFIFLHKPFQDEDLLAALKAAFIEE